MSGVFTAAKKQHWLDAVQWLFYTIAVGAIPFWGTSLILWLLAQHLSVSLFVDHAQLAVYSAGLLAPAIPLMLREAKDSPFRQPRWFVGVAILVLLMAALAFASATLATKDIMGVQQGPFPAVRGARLLAVSVVLATASFSLCFFTELINNIRYDINYRNLRDADVDSLSKAVMKRIEDQDA